jgi:hypothetical protein
MTFLEACIVNPAAAPAVSSSLSSRPQRPQCPLRCHPDRSARRARSGGISAAPWRFTGGELCLPALTVCLRLTTLSRRAAAEVPRLGPAALPRDDKGARPAALARDDKGARPAALARDDTPARWPLRLSTLSLRLLPTVASVAARRGDRSSRQAFLGQERRARLLARSARLGAHPTVLVHLGVDLALVATDPAGELAGLQESPPQAAVHLGLP